MIDGEAMAKQHTYTHTHTLIERDLHAKYCIDQKVFIIIHEYSTANFLFLSLSISLVKLLLIAV